MHLPFLKSVFEIHCGNYLELYVKTIYNKRRNCLIIVASHAISNEVLTFSHELGSYDDSFELSISDANGGKIYYTLDGSLPVVGKSGTYEYVAPVLVNNLKGTEPVLTTVENGSKFTDSIGSCAYTPDKEVLDRATIVRAISVYQDGTFSPVSTRY